PARQRRQAAQEQRGRLRQTLILVADEAIARAPLAGADHEIIGAAAPQKTNVAAAAGAGAPPHLGAEDAANVRLRRQPPDAQHLARRAAAIALAIAKHQRLPPVAGEVDDARVAQIGARAPRHLDVDEAALLAQRRQILRALPRREQHACALLPVERELAIEIDVARTQPARREEAVPRLVTRGGLGLLALGTRDAG